MAISVPLSMVVGLSLAMLLDTKVRGMSVYRTLFFLPAIMPAVAASILWIWVFNAQNGLMNWMQKLALPGSRSVGCPVKIEWSTLDSTPLINLSLSAATRALRDSIS